MIFTFSADLPRKSVAVVPWLWVEPSVLALCLCLTECFENEEPFLWRDDVQRHSLDVFFVRFVQRAKTNLVADLHWQERFQSGPNGRYALCRSGEPVTQTQKCFRTQFIIAFLNGSAKTKIFDETHKK